MVLDSEDIQMNKLKSLVLSMRLRCRRSLYTQTMILAFPCSPDALTASLLPVQQ